MATTLGQINGRMDTKEHVLKGEFIKLQGYWTLHNLLKLTTFELVKQNAKGLYVIS